MKTLPLKRLADINARTLPEATESTRQLRYLDIGAVGRGVLVDAPRRTTFGSAPSRARRIARDGDTVVSTVRTYLRAAWPVEGAGDDLVVSTGFAVLSPRRGVNPRFLGWLAQSDAMVEKIVARSVGVGYPAISPEEIGRIHVPDWDILTQSRIAALLDFEVGRVDGLIDRKQRLLALLNESIDARIMLNVGRSGLARSQVAEGSTRPVRRLLTKLTRPALLDAETVTAFRDGQVTARSIRRSGGFTESSVDNPQQQGVLAGDVVIHGLDGFAGAIGVSEADGVCSPVYHVCQTGDGWNAWYVGRMLRILAMAGYLELFATSTRERAVDLRNWDVVRLIPVPFATPAEQEEVAGRLARLIPIKNAIESSIRLLREHRQALITAAVTGEFLIPGAAE